MNKVPRSLVGVDRETQGVISARYKRITKAVNREFWNSQSETAHSLYVGSYGRNTATSASDIDVLLSLPREEYERYDVYKGNGQSRLLQAVKGAVLSTYPSTDVRADGQVVVLRFSDGMKFELLPAFERRDWYGNACGFNYPDTNMGGNWCATDPKAEQKAVKEKNKDSNGLLVDTCKHIRDIHAENFSSYKLSGIVIDSFVYEAMGSWRWADGGGSTSEPGEYERQLLRKYNDKSNYGNCAFYLCSPGSGQLLDTSKSLACLGKVLREMAE